MEEKELLQQQSYTSFGKLILSDEKTKPTFSFGSAQRFANTGDLITIPKNNPGPIYDVNDNFKYKSVRIFLNKKPSKWKIGNGARPPIHSGEKYEHYDHIYDENYDFKDVPKRWNKVRGAAYSTEPRIKYDFREGVPGPGRYDPDIKTKSKKSPAYYLGEKANFNSLNLLVGTDGVVGPGKYTVEASKKTSKHRDYPKVSFTKDKRKGLNYKTWTQNETYQKYSYIYL